MHNIHKASRHIKRAVRHRRVRARITGTAERPRLSVFRSTRFISAQLIDDVNGTTLASAHGREFGGSLLAQAAAVGKAIGERATVAKITTVVFDRGGFTYTGRIKALAEAAREAGLTF